MANPYSIFIGWQHYWKSPQQKSQTPPRHPMTNFNPGDSEGGLSSATLRRVWVQPPKDHPAPGASMPLGHVWLCWPRNLGPQMHPKLHEWFCFVCQTMLYVRGRYQMILMHCYRPIANATFHLPNVLIYAHLFINSKGSSLCYHTPL